MLLGARAQHGSSTPIPSYVVVDGDSDDDDGWAGSPSTSTSTNTSTGGGGSSSSSGSVGGGGGGMADDVAGRGVAGAAAAAAGAGAPGGRDHDALRREFDWRSRCVQSATSDGCVRQGGGAGGREGWWCVCRERRPADAADPAGPLTFQQPSWARAWMLSRSSAALLFKPASLLPWQKKEAAAAAVCCCCCCCCCALAS